MKNLTLVTGNPYGPEYIIMESHGHWEEYDMELEGCRFNKLQNLFVQSSSFERNRVIRHIKYELSCLAYTQGWTESHGNDALDKTPYLDCVKTSLEELYSNSPMEYYEISDIFSKMEKEYTEGCKIKTISDFRPSY